MFCIYLIKNTIKTQLYYNNLNNITINRNNITIIITFLMLQDTFIMLIYKTSLVLIIVNSFFIDVLVYENNLVANKKTFLNNYQITDYQ